MAMTMRENTVSFGRLEDLVVITCRSGCIRTWRKVRDVFPGSVLEPWGLKNT